MRTRALRALGWLAPFTVIGCADPCLDDGLLQDAPSDCPTAIDIEGSTGGETEAPASETDAGTEGDDTCANGVRDGDETDVDCGGSCETKCGVGEGCGDADDCESETCSDEDTCVPSPTCDNGMRDGDETDVDCGGDACGGCDDGDTCESGDDCLSETCIDDACVTPTCRDGEQNGTETDVDCGGDCSPCEDGEGCNDAEDCRSTVCAMDVCQPPSCDDGVRNGDETDVDCGGACANTCETGEGCSDGFDCVDLVCDPETETCAAPTCDDGAPNGNETDVDCGGPDCPGCPEPGNCEMPSDCLSGVCDEGQCVPPSCDDGVLNGDETDVDCGGDSCAPCEGGEICLEPGDCTSGICDEGTCTTSTCDDGEQNQGETDVDCGGPNCDPCDDGESCEMPSDCVSMSCDPLAEVCEAPTCSDGVQNGDETGLDCGGPDCGGCPTGGGCTSDEDCLSMVCDEDAGACVAPSCDDGVLNGDESDLDCGGPDCDPCDDGEDCVLAGDCVSMVCLMETCQPSACDDGVLNGDETDVDCGGSCQPCDDGDGCNGGSDCVSGVCDDANTCAEPACDDGVQNGDETGLDCGGPLCDACPPGGGCNGNDDCDSGVCDPITNICSAPTCDDGVVNGMETDTDCGGDVCPACDPGETCTDPADCTSAGCTDDACNELLSVAITPNACADAADDGTVSFTAVASGGTGGPYTYSWAPDDGTVASPNMATTDITPIDYASYTVTADDGEATASAVGVVVISNSAFNLEDNCTLYQGDLLGATADASITYSAGGTVATEAGNNDLGLHLCEGVSYTNTRLTGSFAVNTTSDDDFAGLVWGAQDNSHFYILAWKQAAQNDGDFGADCDSGVLETGMVVKRVFAPSFDALTMEDLYCANDTTNSELLLAPADAVSTGWLDNTDYSIEIDFQQTGTTVRVTNADAAALVSEFDVADTTYMQGYFGSHTISQAAVAVGPLFGSCL